MLCDGEILEVFDREENVTAPILRIARKSLLSDFGKLRRLLEPWQVWFFEKRRIVRLIDKVFDREFNLDRVDEFQALVKWRLIGKRSVILANFQQIVKPGSSAEDQQASLRRVATADLVDACFFLNLSIGNMMAMIQTLVQRCDLDPFPVLYKIFPDYPRDASDTYYAYAVTFLVVLRQNRSSVGWLPSWLSNDTGAEKGIEAAIFTLLRACLTQFGSDEARKVTLLCYAGVRRLLKLLSVMRQDAWRIAELQHAFLRYAAPEFAWESFISSPGTQVLQQLNKAAMIVNARILDSCRTSRGDLQVEIAKVKLREIWATEMNLLASVPDYRSLLRERNLGEEYPTESIDVDHDYLGHLTLCLIEHFPKWKSYVMDNHREHVEQLAWLGSRKAQEWLGTATRTTEMSVQAIADRFFFGDVSTLEALRTGYSEP